jgi:hypothetical protein
MRRKARLMVGAVIAAALWSAIVLQAAAAELQGRVVDKTTQRPVAGATVMVQGTQAATHSGADGSFALETGSADLRARKITAWKDGYSIASADGAAGRVTLELEQLPLDNPEYGYLPAQTCGGCHTDILAQWKDTTMGRAMNEKYPQKLSFYLGQTTDGKFDGLGFGWKYFAPMMGISQGMHAMDLDHFVGTCTNCHARGVTWKKGVLEAHETYDPETGHVYSDGAIKVFRMDKVGGLPIADGREGITCDVCHSVADVRIHHDKNGKLRTVDIAKMEIIRRGDVKFGPFKDAVSPFHKTAYSPIYKKSEFCAMCHMERADDLERVGVPSMITLDEYPAWKANFDAGKTDKQCQDCHMYTGGKGAWTADKAATIGVERDPATLAGHHWRGSYFDGAMASHASNLAVSAQRVGDELVVTANVANVGAAHKMPGGPPFRQMLLLVDATDSKGAALTPLDPPRVDPADAQHANRIIDVGGGYRKYGFFKLWELEHGRPFPQMPYAGHVGKVYNGSWVTPPFMPMDWMMRWLWVGVLPLVIGLLGWSPWRATFGGPSAKAASGKRLFSANVGTLDRVLRIAGGALIVAFAPMPWDLIGLVPLMSGVLGWCPTYFIIGGVDTREKSGFFARNVGGVDRTLRIVGGLLLISLYFWGPRSPWGLIGLVPLVSGLLGWCPTYRLIGNLSTRRAGAPSWFAPNLGAGDRLIRAAGGLFLLSLVFWGPQTPWGALGIIPLFTAAIGTCIPYRIAGLDTRGETDRARLFWTPAWVNLDDGERRVRIAAGIMMIFVAVVAPKAFAMQVWPVGGFAAERVLYDTRLDYRESDTTVYRFRAPAGDAHVRARLVYLRHWYFMAPIKGEKYWSTDRWKYLLHEVSVSVPSTAAGIVAADAGNRSGSLADLPPVPSEPGASRWVDKADEGTRVAAGHGS